MRRRILSYGGELAREGQREFCLIKHSQKSDGKCAESRYINRVLGLKRGQPA